MRVAIIGQQAFGKAVLEAFLARGDKVAAVFCAPEKGRPDPLRQAGEAAGVPTHMFPRLTGEAAVAALEAAEADIAVMAYVTQFASQAFCRVPRHGTIQFHPSLLPLHRGASSMSWSIILGRAETGFSIFRPTDGLDEGPVILRRTVPITPDDTLGTLYFGKIFPQGVAGLLEVADQVVAGRDHEVGQVEDGATYEGIVGEPESRVHWASHIDHVYNLVRGCDPSPGAWTTYAGKKLFLFDAAKCPARTVSAVKGKRMGEVIAIDADGIAIQAQGGTLLARRVRLGEGQKAAPATLGIEAGAILGS